MNYHSKVTSLHIALAVITITIEVGTNDATTPSRMYFSGYVGHVTIFS